MKRLDLGMLYNHYGHCRLCEGDKKTHEENCPAYILEGMTYEIVDDRDKVEGKTLEEALDAAMEAGFNSQLFVRFVFEDSELAPEHLVNEARKRTQEIWRKRQEDTRRKTARFEYELAMTRLEKDRPDLSEEGYARRRAAIEAKYPEVKT